MKERSTYFVAVNQPARLKTPNSCKYDSVQSKIAKDSICIYILTMKLLSNTVLNSPQRTPLRSKVLRPPPRIRPHHKLRILLGHHLDILLDQESVVEHARGILRPVLDVSYLRVNPYLDLGEPAATGFLSLALGLVLALLLLRITVRLGKLDRCAQVQYASHGDWVLERTRVKSQEVRAGVGEGGGAAEGELEGLF